MKTLLLDDERLDDLGNGYSIIQKNDSYLISFANSAALPRSPSTFSLPVPKAIIGSSLPSIIFLKSVMLMVMVAVLVLQGV